MILLYHILATLLLRKLRFPIASIMNGNSVYINAHVYSSTCVKCCLGWILMNTTKKKIPTTANNTLSIWYERGVVLLSVIQSLADVC